MTGLDSVAQSLSRALDERWSDSDLVRVLAQAVCDFEALPDEDARWEFVSEPRLTGDPAWDAAVAGLAVHLCRMGGFERTPAWTRHPDRYSRRIAWIGLAPHSTLQAYVFQRTPAYFKARGVMLDEANLVSV
jgi:hypothetical protein